MEGSTWTPVHPEFLGEEDKDRKLKKSPNVLRKPDNKAPENRWVRPPLPLPRYDVLGGLNQRQDSKELPQSEPLYQEAVERRLKEAEEGDGQEAINQEFTEAPPEVFEVFIESKPKPLAELLTDEQLQEIPLINDNELQAQIQPETPQYETFEEIMQQEMDDPEFIKSVSASGKRVPTEPSPMLNSPAPTPEASPVQPPFDFDISWGAEPQPRPAPVASGDVAPSWSYGGPSYVPGSFESGRPPGPEPRPIYTPPKAESRPSFPLPSVADVLKVAKVAGDLVELANSPNLAIARFITGIAIDAYLAERRSDRIKLPDGAELQRRNDQVARLQQAQAEQYKVLSQRPPELRPQIQEQIALGQQEIQEVFDLAGNKIIIPPGGRVVRSTEGYSVILDKYNRVVNDYDENYGNAYRLDKKREQVNPDVFGVGDAGAVGGGAYVVLPSAPVTGSVQIDPSHELEPGALADLQHRLPKPRNQVVAAITSPWLWTAIALLLIVYFMAALA